MRRSMHQRTGETEKMYDKDSCLHCKKHLLSRDLSAPQSMTPAITKGNTACRQLVKTLANIRREVFSTLED